MEAKNIILLNSEEFEKLDFAESFKGAVEKYYGNGRKVKQVIIIVEDRD